MHYYTRNIADFNNATRHLTRQERSIYSDLIELQYDNEEPLPDDIEWICRRVLAFTDSERTDVERMLNEFFDLVEQGWSNARCESEIHHFKEKQAKAKAAGKASGEARRRNKKPTKNNKKEIKRTDVEQTLNESRTDVELTNNQEPITNLTMSDVKSDFENLWNSFPVDLGSKGSKKNAYSEFRKLKPDRELTNSMTAALSAQIADKREKRRAGCFVENFQHVERWIRNRRWEDDLGSVEDDLGKMAVNRL